MKILLLAVFFLTLSFADYDDYEERFHIPKDLSFLKLDKAQKESVKKLLTKHREKLKELHKEEEDFEEELKAMFKRDSFDKKLFLQKSMRIKRDITIVEAEFFSKIYKILSKKQREKFAEYIEEWEVE